MFNLPCGAICNYMKTKILTLLFSAFAALTFSSCIDTESSSSSNGGNNQTTPTIYELKVNDATWEIYSQKINLIDNAKKDPENYEYDYTLNITAADASNQINADSKIFNFYFDADDLDELKNENMTDCENLHLLYRGKMEVKPTRYNPTGGVMTITEINSKTMTVVFNSFTMQAEKGGLLLPGQEPATLTIHGEVKCNL